MDPVEDELYAPERLEPRIAAMKASRRGLFRTWLHRRLRLLFSDFDVNAMLGMYPMTFLTTEEWQRLLPEAGGRLLDVGAGSGDLTRALSPLFSGVVCTETSTSAAKRLRREGFDARTLDLAREPLEGEAPFDALALLHVLDRADAPLTLLGRALALLRPGGLALVAVPLPYAPLVYHGRHQSLPREFLFSTGMDEAAQREALGALLSAHGVEPLRSARVPYLCPGDLESPYYMLDSCLIIGRRR